MKNSINLSIFSAGLLALSISGCNKNGGENMHPQIEQCSDIQRGAINKILSNIEKDIPNLDCKDIELRHGALYDKKNEVYYAINGIKILEIITDSQTGKKYIYIPTGNPGVKKSFIVENIVHKEGLEILGIEKTLEREGFSYLGEVKVNVGDRALFEIINKVKKLQKTTEINVSGNTKVLLSRDRIVKLWDMNNIRHGNRFVVFSNGSEVMLYFLR